MDGQIELAIIGMMGAAMPRISQLMQQRAAEKQQNRGGPMQEAMGGAMQKMARNKEAQRGTGDAGAGDPRAALMQHFMGLMGGGGEKAQQRSPQRGGVWGAMLGQLLANRGGVPNFGGWAGPPNPMMQDPMAAQQRAQQAMMAQQAPPPMQPQMAPQMDPRMQQGPTGIMDGMMV